MQLSCPHCGFSREIPAERRPTRAVRVTCPRCREPFQWVPPAEGNDTPAEPAAMASSLAKSAPAAEDSPPQPAASPARDSHPRGGGHQVVCSACGLIQPAGERCRGCGVLFGAIATAATAATPSFRFAGFWLRLTAFLLDSLLVSVFQFVLSFLLLQASRLAGAPIDEKTFLIHLTLEFFGMVLAIAYFVFFTGYSGQTPGKRVMKLRVVRTDGSAVGYGRAFLREVPGKLISGVLLGIGYLMVIFHPKKQGLHDLLADTYVIKT